MGAVAQDHVRVLADSDHLLHVDPGHDLHVPVRQLPRVLGEDWNHSHLVSYSIFCFDGRKILVQTFPSPCGMVVMLAQ